MLKMENAVLVVIDIQGKLASLMHNREIFYANAAKMIKGARALEIPVIWNEQLPDKLGPTVQEIKEQLDDNNPLVKNSFSCCGNEAFIERLESLKRNQILLVGMETHVCVYRTAMDLIERNYEVHLVADAVSSRSAENIEIGKEAMKSAGANITSVEMSLLEMLDIAKGDKFKQIIEIIK